MEKRKNKGKKLEEIRIINKQKWQLELKDKFKSTIAKHKLMWLKILWHRKI